MVPLGFEIPAPNWFSSTTRLRGMVEVVWCQQLTAVCMQRAFGMGQLDLIPQFILHIAFGPQPLFCMVSKYQHAALVCYHFMNKYPKWLLNGSFSLLLIKQYDDTVPLPPLEIPPPPAIPPQGGGDHHFTVLLGNIYCSGLCSPSVTHTFLYCFPITSNQSPVCIL